MSLEISRETEARLADEARKQGVSIDALLARLINEHAAMAHPGVNRELPIWHLGDVGPLHRRDIYDDVR
jgi:hypothetical protein